MSLQQVSDTPASDIQIGFANFATQTTGLIGLTTYQEGGTQMPPGTVIQLEDRNEDPIGGGQNGNLTYTASGVQLEQLALHEVGHALGLADSFDPNSIMYAELGSNNTTLDGTDFADIQALYGAALANGTTGLLIQSMASFAASPPAPVTTVPVLPQAADVALAASSMH